jgi:hypothetical protein
MIFIVISSCKSLSAQDPRIDAISCFVQSPIRSRIGRALVSAGFWARARCGGGDKNFLEACVRPLVLERRPGMHLTYYSCDQSLPHYCPKIRQGRDVSEIEDGNSADMHSQLTLASSTEGLGLIGLAFV